MTSDDAALARAVAEEAGALLLELQRATPEGGRALGDAGDAQANILILDRLRAARPDDAILSEEARDDRARLANARVWIVDPLDGTREFREGRGDWAVHVALCVDGAPTSGAVALPARGLTLGTDAPIALPAHVGRPRMLVSRTRPAKGALAVAERLGAELVAMGSAGAKAGAVLLGDADIYLHSGGMWEWDNAAPVAVALAAGCHATRIDGSAFVYNQAVPFVPDLLICRPEWAARVLALVREVGMLDEPAAVAPER